MSNTIIEIKVKDKNIGTALYSYGTLVAAKIETEAFIASNAYNHSRTTSKHINSYFGSDRKTVEKGLATKVDNLDEFIFEKKMEVHNRLEKTASLSDKLEQAKQALSEKNVSTSPKQKI